MTWAADGESARRPPDPPDPHADLARNKAVVAEFIEIIWRQGKLDDLGRFWTADCVNQADPLPAKVGLDPLRQYHAGFAEAFADFTAPTIEILQQVAEGDLVVTHLATRATHTLTSRRVSLSTIRIDRLRRERIAEHWSVADMAGLMAQIEGPTRP